MAHTDHLWPGGPCFFYDDALFKPGTDSFLLAAFARTKPGERFCDLGCGTGLLCLLLLARQPSLWVTGVELQEAAAALAEKTAQKNALEERMRVLRADLRHLEDALPAGSFDACICNPPYFKRGHGAASPAAARQAARCDETATLAEICTAAARLLRWGGRLTLSFRPERLTDLLCATREAGLEPKRLCFVEARRDCAPSLLLLEARRGGNPGLIVTAPLVLSDETGHPTPEYNIIYFRNQEEPS